LLAVSACSQVAPAPEPAQQTATPIQQPGADPSAAAARPIGNQLQNPGFEQGSMPWGAIRNAYWVGFEVTDEPVHSGRHAAHLLLSWQPGDREKPISARGAIQEISPSHFPDRISGWYRVDHWESPSDPTLVYLDVAVAAIGDPLSHDVILPDDPELYPELDNYQIRYYLGGLTEPYENLLNMRAKLVHEGPPELGKWLYFEFPIKADFEELWGRVPADFRSLRVFFEVRWEQKEPGAAVRADLYYDDLFFGFDEPPES
jgi:hypothetical protein